jgi:competence protein ComEC
MTDFRLVPAAALTWIACLVGVAWSGPALWAAAGSVGLLTIAVGVAGRRRPDRAAGVVTAWLALIAVGVAFASCAAQVQSRDAGLLARLATEGATATVVGTVRSEALPVMSPWPDAEPQMRFVLGADEVTGRGWRGSAAAAVLVLAEQQTVPYGARVSATGFLTAARAGDDVAAILRPLDGVVVLTEPGPVDSAVGRVGTALLEVSDPLSPDLRGLVPGAAIGDTTRVQPDLAQAMRDVSLTHITAVSGGHFGVLSVSVLALTAVLGLPGWARAGVTAVAMGGFVLLVHPDPSVVRAAGMGAVAVLGMVLGRPSRAVPGLCSVVVTLLVLDPWLARSYGFVLSVLATAAIAVLAPVVAGWLDMVPRWLAVALAVPVAAQAICGPVLVLLDPSVSVYAVPANLLAAPALLPATVLGVGAAVAAPVWPALGAVLANGAGGAVWWIATVARTCAGLPGARHDWPSGPVGAGALLVATAVVLAILPALRRWGGRAGAVVLVVGTAVAVGGAHVGPQAWPPRDWRVIACDVGQGDALVMRSGPGSAVVVDVGPQGPAADTCLDRLGITHIDLLVLTHHHADHVGGLEFVLVGRAVDRALVSPLDEPAGEAERTRALLAGADIPVEVASVDGPHPSGTAGEVAWTVLSPVASLVRPDQINDASIVLLLQAPDLTVLALGDAEPAAQERIAGVMAQTPPGWRADVVKVAHHGSASQSDGLISLLAPPVAVISVGADNDYGHPAPSTVDAFRAVGSTVLTTSECGPVAVARTASGLEVSAACLGP